MDNKVAIIKCEDYDFDKVYTAVKKSIDLIGGIDVKDKKVLLNPNILISAKPERLISTNPVFLKAVIKLFQEAGARVLVGDCPAAQSGYRAGKATGLVQVTKELGAEWVDLSETLELDNPEGRLVKHFTVSKVFSDIDALVSLPKLKTHSFMYYTGALKKIFGMIPGLLKAQFHFRFPDKDNFADMLIDLNVLLKPQLGIIDAVTAMEGPGPSGGYPYNLGLILASKNPLALDITACRIIGYDPMDIPMMSKGLERKLWLNSIDEIEVTGNKLSDVSVKNYKLIKIVSGAAPEKRKLPKFIFSIIKDITVPRPVFSKQRCTRCGDCIDICPAKALTFKPYSKGKFNKYVAIDYDKCIRCYCCHEVCPSDAIDLKRIALGRQD